MQSNQGEKEVIEVDDDDSNEKPEDIAASKTLASRKAWRVPDEIEGSTLYKEFGVRTVGYWLCPLCLHVGQNNSRLHGHCLEKHSKVSGMLDLVEKSVNEHCKAEKRAAHLATIRKLRGNTAVLDAASKSSSQIVQWCSVNSIDLIKNALAQAVIEGELPIAICQSTWIKYILDAGIQIGARSTYDSIANGGGKNLKAFSNYILPDASDFKVSRTALTATVDDLCINDIDFLNKQALALARLHGATQVSDGRSNVGNDALLVFGLQIGEMFLPLGAHNAGANKKDASYLCKRHVEYLGLNADLANETFASVADGAAAAQKALKNLADQEHLVDIVCQAHGLSLFLKDVSTRNDCFKMVVDQAEQLVQWIRNHPRIHSIVKKNSDGKAVFRFVPIRFGTYLTGCMRLLDLRYPILRAINDPVYLQYKDETFVRGSQKNTAEDMEKIVNNPKFWSQTKAYCTFLQPALVALREMDRSVTRCKDVPGIWSILEEQLRCAPITLGLDATIKDNVLRVLNQRRRDYHRPVFDAAFVLNPENLEIIREAAHDPTSDFAINWLELKSNTEKVLRMMTRRKALLFLRKKLLDSDSSRKKARENLEFSDGGVEMLTIPSEEIDKKFAEFWLEVGQSFRDYYSGGGVFAPGEGHPELETEKDWIRANCGLLRYFAPRILNMACTISDVERLHKVYSRIHTPTRNQLLDDRVDRLTLARVSRRISRIALKKRFDIRETPLKKSMKEAEEVEYQKDLQAWGESVILASTATQRTILAPTEAEECRFEFEGENADLETMELIGEWKVDEQHLDISFSSGLEDDYEYGTMMNDDISMG